MERRTDREQQSPPQRWGAVGERSPEADDLWAGEDQAWEDADYASAESRKAVSFFRGLLVSTFLGGIAWLLLGLGVYLLFFA